MDKKNLSLKEITDITLGAVEIIEKNKTFIFFRFSEEERMFYSEGIRYNKMLCTAGIQMEFETDGTAIEIAGRVSSHNEMKYYSFDVFKNGEIAGYIKNFESVNNTEYVFKEYQLGDFNGKVELGEGNKKIRVVFPYTVQCEISSIVLNNATYIKPIKKSKIVFTYGDSITHGYYAQNPSETYSVKIAEYMGAELFNKGLDGEVYCPGLVEKRSYINPDYITVAYGTNDWCRGISIEEFEKRVKKFYENCSRNYPEAKIFAISPIWRSDINSERTFGFSDIAKVIEETVKEYNNVIFINGRNLVPEDENCFGDLSLHPNNYGFSFYFENLKEIITNHLFA